MPGLDVQHGLLGPALTLVEGYEPADAGTEAAFAEAAEKAALEGLSDAEAGLPALRERARGDKADHAEKARQATDLRGRYPQGVPAVPVEGLDPGSRASLEGCLKGLTAEYGNLDVPRLEAAYGAARQKAGDASRKYRDRVAACGGLERLTHGGETAETAAPNREMANELIKELKEYESLIEDVGRKTEAANAVLACLSTKFGAAEHALKSECGLDAPAGDLGPEPADYEGEKAKLVRALEGAKRRLEKAESDRNALGASLSSVKDALGRWPSILAGREAEGEISESSFDPQPYRSMEVPALAAACRDAVAAHGKSHENLGRGRGAVAEALRGAKSDGLVASCKASERYCGCIDALLASLDRAPCKDDPGAFLAEAHEKLGVLEAVERMSREIYERYGEEVDRAASSICDALDLLCGELERVGNGSTIDIGGRGYKCMSVGLKNGWNRDSRGYYMPRVREHLTSRILPRASEAFTAARDRPRGDGESGERAVRAFLRREMTLSSLFGAVVGYDQVEVKVAKKEESSVSMKPWPSLCKLSGGELFISYYIVVLALMKYAEREDAVKVKRTSVLLLDNPFAQTQAEHLLDAMFDLAARNRVQLVCLTGIDMSNILSKFPDIHVLRLGFKKGADGVRYLSDMGVKTARGERPLISANVRVLPVGQGGAEAQL